MSSPYCSNPTALLQAAQVKLFAPHVPAVLRIIGFLRLSCAAMPEPGLYSKLMQTLCDCDPEWWSSCEITETELLVSSISEINTCLAPVLALHGSLAYEKAAAPAAPHQVPQVPQNVCV